MKKLLVLVVMFAFVAVFVSATNVDCGHGHGSECSESEIQHAVDTLDAKDRDLQNQINGLPTGGNGNPGNGGGGMTPGTLGTILTGDYNFFDANEEPWLYYLDTRYCSAPQYKDLNDRVTLIEQFLIEKLGYNPNDKGLELRAAQRLGHAKDTECYSDIGMCIRTIN